MLDVEIDLSLTQLTLDLRERSSEVDAFVRCHGLSFDEACELAGIRKCDYLIGCDLIDWLPLPDMIYEEALFLRQLEFRDIVFLIAGPTRSFGADSKRICRPN